MKKSSHGLKIFIVFTLLFAVTKPLVSEAGLFDWLSGGEPISVETALRSVPPVIGSIGAVQKLKGMCLDVLTYEVPKARRLNTFFSAVPLGTVSCSNGGEFDLTIQNNTAPTDRLRRAFACESTRIHKACKTGTVTANGTVKARYKEFGVLAGSPRFTFSFADFYLVDSADHRTARLDGTCEVADIKQKFRAGRFVLNLDFSFSLGDVGSQTAIGAIYKDFRVDWESTAQGDVYIMSGRFTPAGTNQQMRVSTEVPLFVPENQQAPQKGVLAIKAGSDKIRVVVAEQREEVYLNGERVR